MKAEKKISSLDPDTLVRLIEIAYDLRCAFMSAKGVSKDDVQASMPMLLTLLEYLIENEGDPSLDATLIPFLRKILGYAMEEEKDLEREETEEEISEEERKQQHRWLVYQAYQVINPRKLAGITELENFINNVKTRGIEIALQYEGKEYATKVEPEVLDNLASYKGFMKQLMKDSGNVGFGPGL